MTQARIFFKKRKAPIITAFLLIATFAIYSVYWFSIARSVQENYVSTLQEISRHDVVYTAPNVSGFPGKLTFTKPKETIQTPTVTLMVDSLHASTWPLPSAFIQITTGRFVIQSIQWKNPLVFDGFNAHLNIKGNLLNVKQSKITQGDFIASLTGIVDFTQTPYPKPDLSLSMENNDQFLLALGDAGIIDTRAALFINAGLNTFQKDGIVTLPIHQKGQTIYAGPIPVASLPDVSHQEPRNQPAQAQ